MYILKNEEERFHDNVSNTFVKLNLVNENLVPLALEFIYGNMAKTERVYLIHYPVLQIPKKHDLLIPLDFIQEVAYLTEIIDMVKLNNKHPDYKVVVVKDYGEAMNPYYCVSIDKNSYKQSLNKVELNTQYPIIICLSEPLYSFDNSEIKYANFKN